MRRVLLHIHIFKNAGSTIDWALARSFGSRFHAFDGHSPRGVLDAAIVEKHMRETPDGMVYSSHQARLPVPVANDLYVRPMLALRHPIDRVASVYSFERKQKKDTPGSLHARKLDFPDYVRWRLDGRDPTVLTNFQANVCTALQADRPRADRHRAVDLQAACDFVDSDALVAVVERLDDSLVQFESALSSDEAWRDDWRSIDLSHAPQNVSRDRSRSLEERIEDVRRELGATLYDELESRNAADLAIYQHAVERLDAQLALIPDLASHRSAFAARCRSHSEGKPSAGGLINRAVTVLTRRGASDHQQCRV